MKLIWTAGIQPKLIIRCDYHSRNRNLSNCKSYLENKFRSFRWSFIRTVRQSLNWLTGCSRVVTHILAVGTSFSGRCRVVDVTVVKRLKWERMYELFAGAKPSCRWRELVVSGCSTEYTINVVGGSVTGWSACKTWNPAVPGSSPTLTHSDYCMC